MENSDAIRLLEKYKLGQCTEVELAILEKWYNDMEIFTEVSGPEMEKDLMEVRLLLPRHKTVKMSDRLRIMAAAAILFIVFAIGLLYTINKGNHAYNGNNQYGKHDISPAKNTVTLTLSDGTILSLNGSKTGLIVHNESLSYNDGTKVQDAAEKKSLVSTITVPKGTNYEITLPDGSVINLNAESTLKFPTSFSRLATRRVELKGEGYFNVAKDRSHPFIVATRRQEVEVLGTQFNINSYEDENKIKTTLLEGSVKIQPVGLGKSTAVFLKPGQIGINANNKIDIKNADVELELAWKNGVFVFKGEKLENLMQEISRWYNIRVIYAEESSKNLTLEGVVSRSRNLSEILERMEATGSVSFKLDGRVLMVLNKN